MRVGCQYKTKARLRINNTCDADVCFAFALARALEMDFSPTLTPRDKSAGEKGAAV